MVPRVDGWPPQGSVPPLTGAGVPTGEAAARGDHVARHSLRPECRGQAHRACRARQDDPLHLDRGASGRPGPGAPAWRSSAPRCRGEGRGASCAKPPSGRSPPSPPARGGGVSRPDPGRGAECRRRSAWARAAATRAAGIRGPCPRPPDARRPRDVAPAEQPRGARAARCTGPGGGEDPRDHQVALERLGQVSPPDPRHHSPKAGRRARERRSVGLRRPPPRRPERA